MSHADAVRPAVRVAISSSDDCTFEVIVTAIEDTRATVQLHGEMDVSTAEVLTAVLDSQLAAGRRFVRLDLSGLAFLDCAGLRVLAGAHSRFLDVGGTLLLTGIGNRIARLLSITHLDEELLVSSPYE